MLKILYVNICYLAFLANLEIKNTQILNWIKNTLKENHTEEKSYHNRALAELNEQYSQIQHKIDLSYEDRVEGQPGALGLQAES